MWGAVGVELATFISGSVYDHTAGGHESIVVVFVVVLVLALVATLGVPVGTNRDESCDGQKSEGSRYVFT